MVDTIPSPEFVDVSDRTWKPIAHYLPHKHGKVSVSKNPERAKEEIYDAMKRAKKSSGKKHLDPLMKGRYPERMVNSAVGDLLGHHTLIKSGKGRWRIVKNFFASKLGWAPKRTIRVMELPKLRGKRRRRKRIR
jgi:hypothetical protein